MQFAHLPPLAASLFSLLATVSLLFSFVMLGSRWISSYLYAFAGESLTIAALSAAVGYYGGYPELYLIALLTALFRGTAGGGADRRTNGPLTKHHYPRINGDALD
jgi:hydrogenase-4 component E